MASVSLAPSEIFGFTDPLSRIYTWQCLACGYHWSVDQVELVRGPGPVECPNPECRTHPRPANGPSDVWDAFVERLNTRI